MKALLLAMPTTQAHAWLTRGRRRPGCQNAVSMMDRTSQQQKPAIAAHRVAQQHELDARYGIHGVRSRHDASDGIAVGRRSCKASQRYVNTLWVAG